MSVTNFNTDSFRDLTFDVLSGIANDSTKFDELNDAYMNKIHERSDGEDLRKYTKDIYEKILCKKEKYFIRIKTFERIII